MAVSIDSSKCTGCGSCVDDCRLGALSVVNGMAFVDPDSCVECGVCLVDSCPADAIRLPYPGVATIWV